jgi:predicted NAD/FAD-binding protein
VVCLLRLQVLEFPVQMLVRFWVNHHLLDLIQRPCWRVVKGRSRNYVNKVLEGEYLP